MLKIYVNNNSILVNPNTTVLESCENLGIEIPRFCFHSRLSIAGNCRMCLVEIEKSPKPVVSCAMPVMDGMKIFTNTPLVKKARENVLEFLLLNHPLDCPVCDQGGECDLQDQALIYGSDRSRFYEFKRSTLDKNVGPLIKTIMTRCIHCTRCVRFADEIAGVGDLGTTSRGIDTEIGTYIEKIFQSELSGNVIDLCPVGALTSQSYAFKYRPWELKTSESIDTSDAIGSNIRVDFKEKEIIRILPVINDEINEEWISDKTRFCHIGNNSITNRLESPKARRLLNNFKPYISQTWWIWSVLMTEKNINLFNNEKELLNYNNWETCFWVIKSILTFSKNSTLIGLSNNNSSLEAQSSLKYLLNSLGSSNIGFEKNCQLENSFVSNFRLNSTLKNINKSDFCLLIGTNPRYEGSLLNVSLRKRYLEGNFSIFSIGTPINLTYPVKHIGNNLDFLFKLLNGKNNLCKKLLKSKRPVIIIGSNIFKRFDIIDIQQILNFFKKYTQINNTSWRGINILQSDSNFTGSLELGVNYLDDYKLSKSRILYSINSEEESFKKRILPFHNYFRKKDYFCLINQGFFKNNPLQNYSDIILPNSSVMEEEGSFLNTEGRYQKTAKVLPSLKWARNSWKITAILSKILSRDLKYNSLKELKYHVLKQIPSTNIMHTIEKSLFHNTQNYVINRNFSKTIFRNLIEDFYTTNSITKKSTSMLKCSVVLRRQSNNFDKK